MPRRRRPQSPADAAEIQNLAKKQKSEKESEVKTNAEPRPVSSEATSRASLPQLPQKEWTIGSPLPASIIPSQFLPSSRFQPQAVKELDGDKKLAALRSWKLSE